MGRWDITADRSMKAISVILSLGMIGIGVYGLANSGGDAYWYGAIGLGAIWLIVDIIAIKRNKG